MRKATVLYSCLIMLTGFVLLVSVFRIVTTTAPDFSVYFHSVRNLVSGRNIYADQTLYTGLGYPPFSLLPMLPFAILPYTVSQAAFIILSIVAVAGISAAAIRLYWPPVTLSKFSILLFLTSISFPVRFTLGMGQLNLIVLLLLILSVYLKHRTWVSAGLLAVSVLLKPHLILILPFFLRSFPVTVAYALGMVGGVAYVTGVIFGFELYSIYYSDLVVPLLEFRGREIYYNQGIAALFSRVLPVHIAYGVSSVASLMVYVGSFLISFRRSVTARLALSIGLTVLVLIEPLAWQHHLVFLIPGFAYLLGTQSARMPGAVASWISYLLVSSNLRDPSAVRSGFLGALVLSHGTFGSMILWILLCRSALRRSLR